MSEPQDKITKPPPKPSPPFSTLSLLFSSSPLSQSASSPAPPQSAAQPLSAAPPPSLTRFKIPSQISLISFISNQTPSSPAISRRSSISPSILPSASPFPRRLPSSSSPSPSSALRRTTLLWLRSDLRIHDNEALSSAHNDSLSILPVFLFDPRDFSRSSSGFDKTGPHRAAFLIQSVADLRRSLRSRGSDLIIRIGRPETVLVDLARAVGAGALYLHREVSCGEAGAEERVGEAMEKEGVEVKGFWGSTLYHIDDLPFELADMPTSYGGFRERVKGLGVRKAIEALDRIKGLPKRGNVEPGEVPTLLDLGISPAPTFSQDGKPAVNASLVGGETEALERLKKFAAECCAQPNKDSKNGAQESIYGANFSCKISPWLAMGSLSPRFMFEELKKTANRSIRAKNSKNVDSSGDTGMNWLMFELLWRDFFRFITKKYSTKKKVGVEPVTTASTAPALC